MSRVTQYCTFQVGDNFFGVPVLEVQEVIRPQAITPVPLAEKQIRGLINLRGQIVTLVNLRELFGLGTGQEETTMNVVVKSNESLYALVVDGIHDVLDVELDSFDRTPPTLDPQLRPFVKGIHKISGNLLIVLDLTKIFEM